MTRSLLPFLFILPSLVYSLITLFAVRAFFRRAPAAAGFTPPVSIIKPVKGLDTGSRENFESFLCQDYPVFQIVFALRTADDPCLPLIRELMAAFPQLDIDLVVDPAVHGANGKVCSLINAWPLVKHDIIVIADSDVRVTPDWLHKVAAFFAVPDIGLVTSLYRGAEVHGAAAAIEALGFATEMIPNVIVAERLEGLSFALGAAMTVRRSALESIGGFSALVDYLADDYQLGNMIHRAGWQLALSGDFVESVMQRESLADLLARQLRWCRTMRVSRPGGYLASGITHPFPAVVAALAGAAFSLPAAGAVLLLYLVRGAVMTLLSRTCLGDRLLPGYLWLLPLRDALSSITWALAFTGNRVRWRGELLTLTADGKITRED